MEWIKEHKLYIIAGLAAAIFFIYSAIDSQGEIAEVNEELIVMNEQKVGSDVPVPEEKPLVMMADIKGAVVQPGVYEIDADDRVIDLIELAGGLTDDAEAASINFAMHVSDEMVIIVPRKGESTEGYLPLQGGQQTQTKDKQTVNLNTAEASDLETLPGIGPSKAEAIIEYRETNGPYKSIEDLKSISGIGDKTFEKLKDHISVK